MAPPPSKKGGWVPKIPRELLYPKPKAGTGWPRGVPPLIKANKDNWHVVAPNGTVVGPDGKPWSKDRVLNQLNDWQKSDFKKGEAGKKAKNVAVQASRTPAQNAARFKTYFDANKEKVNAKKRVENLSDVQKSAQQGALKRYDDKIKGSTDPAVKARRKAKNKRARDNVLKKANGIKKLASRTAAAGQASSSTTPARNVDLTYI